MKRGMIRRVSVYFLCISFLLMMNGFHGIVVFAGERIVAIGEMISDGDVTFEARKGTWKEVEPSHFPIFPGMKIKTGKGRAVVALSGGSRVEIGPDSVCSFERGDALLLSRGQIGFRIPASSELGLKAGNLSILRSSPFQASTVPLGAGRSEEIIGSISLHENGAVTVNSIQGKLTVVNQERAVLAALSTKESITVPSGVTGVKPRVMVAQAPGALGGIGGGLGGVGLGGGLLLGGLLVGGAVTTVVVVGNKNNNNKDKNPACP